MNTDLDINADTIKDTNTIMDIVAQRNVRFLSIFYTICTYKFLKFFRFANVPFKICPLIGLSAKFLKR